MRTTTIGKETVIESDEIFCVVWSWTSHYDVMSVEHRLTWIKDEPVLYYEIKNPAGKWISTPVRNGAYRPNNHKQAREMAHKFIGGGE